ncbi:endonuclease/exonuclease/phosphatase family metal-dependent hydrolase [Sphingomonas jejuensis]|uniref:Endonuclease/exonuclease/phosphatase family metal-dependent hydrolase n=1 Tax=Sphingomonas jejuensis TaxID=904715 RepID=A0ABX0XL37_9SPHN|nr:endonuclease/exonuclease/phosphatase family protein [Sphingomonas jejuensis]NJC33577.1 endonuclease/exonuclease/phosphatase family metal-dependent hydrolase [Sphingomonas jejuensis]
MTVVVSYNMRKAIGIDRRRRPERTLEVLCEIDPDVVALQEADRRFGTRAAALPQHLIEDQSALTPVPFGVRALSIGWHGNAILVRKGTTILHREVLHIPALEPRGAVLAEVELAGGPLRILGMHLDLSGLWRRRQAHAILAHVAARPPMPTVMMGDLNEWTAGGCLRDFGRDYRFADCGRSFHTRRPLAALDRIMVSDDLGIEDAGVHMSIAARHASDHFPIWARLGRR